MLDLSATAWRPQVGERVRVVPNHVCVSVNLQDRLLARDPAEIPPPRRNRAAAPGGCGPQLGADSRPLPFNLNPHER